MRTNPWNLNPDLKEEQIVEIGNLIADVRGEVIDLHDEALGDTRLSLGMRAYECCRSRIIAESNHATWPWLSILTATGRFTFAINGTPVRFVRNDPEQLPSDKLVPSEETLHQMTLFPDDALDANVRWFFVIDTFYKNVADNMYFVGYNPHGEIICQWDIPLESKAVSLVAIDDESAAPVEIQSAPIKVKTIRKDTTAENGNKN